MTKRRNLFLTLTLCILCFVCAIISLSTAKTVSAGSNVIDAGYGYDLNKNPYIQDDNIVIYVGLSNTGIADYTEYKCQSTDAVTLTRNGVTTEVGSTSGNALTSHNNGEFVLMTITFNFAGVLPLQDNDLITINGSFSTRYGGATEFTVGKTLIAVTKTDSVYTAKVTSGQEIYDGGTGYTWEVEGDSTTNVSDGKLTGLYFGLEDNDKIPSNSNWSIEYAPVEKSSIGILRDGIYYEVARPFSNGFVGTLINIGVSSSSAANLSRWYYKTEAYTFDENCHSLLPLIDGDIVIFDGKFVSKDSKTIFTINNTAITISNDGNYYANVDTNFRESLVSEIKSNFDYMDYEKYTEVETLLKNVYATIRNEENSYTTIINEYINVKQTLKSYALNSEGIQKLTTYKNSALQSLEEIKETQSSYYDSEWTTITNTITEYTSKINEDVNIEEVKRDLGFAINSIDNVDKKYKVIENTIENLIDEGDYSQYIVKYNSVSLSSLNLSDFVINSTNSIDTDTYSNTAYNTFAMTEDNTTSSVELTFNYNSNYATWLKVRLRGLQYYGYIFTLGVGDGTGVWIQSAESDLNNLFLTGLNNVLTLGDDNRITIGAIDTTDESGYNTGRTFIYFKVNGQMKYYTFTDKLFFATRARITFYASQSSEGTCMVSNVSENLSTTSSIATGMFKISSGHTDGNNGIYVKLSKNAIPYSSDRTLGAYPINSSAITLTRGSDIYNVDISKAYIYKYSETEYYIDFTKTEHKFIDKDGNEVKLDFAEGDIIKINCLDGECNFAVFDEESYSKKTFALSNCSFVYQASSTTWKQGDINIEGYKEIAVTELTSYFDSSLYDEEGIQSVNNAINNGKTAINNASDVNGVDSELENAKANIDTIKTKLDKAKDQAISDINNYLPEGCELSVYREEQKTEILTIKGKAAEQIKKCTSDIEIKDVKDTYTGKIDNVKTDSQLLDEELDSVRLSAIQSVKDCFGKLDPSAITQEMVDEVKQTIDSINKATTSDDISSMVDTYLDKYQQTTKSDKSSSCSCGSSIMTEQTGLLLVLVYLVVAYVCIKDKTRKEN